MPYKIVSRKSGKPFYLHTKEVQLRWGRTQTIYYFAPTIRSNAIDALPEGYLVTENPRIGLPLLKRKPAETSQQRGGGVQASGDLAGYLPPVTLPAGGPQAAEELAAGAEWHGEVAASEPIGEQAGASASDSRSTSLVPGS